MNSSAMLLKYYVGLVQVQALRLAQALPLATQVSISPAAHAACCDMTLVPCHFGLMLLQQQDLSLDWCPLACSLLCC